MSLKVPSSVFKNIVANYAGVLATTVVAFLLTPVYISYIGVGAYGVIGLYVTVQTLLSFLDMGIGVAINREMARHYHDVSQRDYLRKLTHSLQVVYWAMALIIGVSLFFATPYLAKNWFKDSAIPTQNFVSVFSILSITIFMRWPYGLYSSAIRGMQHQVALNVYEICFNLAKSIGSWLVLKYISPTLTAFIWYQCIITILQTSGIFIIVWRYLSSNSALKFDKDILKSISKYAAGMGVGTIIASVVSQLDKVIVSKTVSDTNFGYYTLAGNIAILVFSISLPIYMAIFPHFTKKVQDGDKEGLATDFHYFSKLLSSLLLPFGVIVICNAKALMLLWLKNETIAEQVSPILQWLMAGTVCNALIMPVHTLLLAKARVRFMLYSQLIEFACMVPIMLVLINKMGVVGGAMGVFILFFGYLLIQAPLIFKTTQFNSLKFNWYIKDIVFFLLPQIVVSIGFYMFIFPYFNNNNGNIIIYLSVLFIISYGISILSNKLLVTKIKSILNSILKK